MTTAAPLKSKSPSPKESEDFKEPWKGVCSSRCYFAESDKKRCKCKCRGEHHGKGHQLRQEEKGIKNFL
jgi:hypothetical protein